MADTYVVSVNGFTCHTETRDNIFEIDGKRDEVFLSWDVRTYEAAHPDVALLESNDRGTTMGDTWRLPNRVQAGTASDRGGIKTGDTYPTPEPWKPSGALRVDGVPPAKLWQGEVREDRVTLITPTIWEWDGGTSAFEGFLDWSAQNDTQHAGKAKEIFGTYPFVGTIIDGVSLVVQTVSTLTGTWAPLGTDRNRPVGLQRDPANPKGVSFKPHTLVLTPPLAQFMASYDGGKGPGVLTLTYTDDPTLWGEYSLYLQVTKVGGTPAAGVPTQAGWLWCSRCQGMFFGDLQAQSVCPGGGAHVAQADSGSGAYSVPHGAQASADRQDGWSWCDTCQGLFWGRAWAGSHCPAGGPHTDPAVSGSGAYSLWHQAPADPSRQDDWRWCSTCMGLFFNGGGATQPLSVCPAGGPHAPVTASRSGNYAIPHVPA